MKALLVATVRSHIGQFHMPLVKKLKEEGWTVDAAYRDNSADKKGLDLSLIDNVFEVPFERSPFKINNIKAFFQLKRIIESGQYSVVHCNTPVGGVIGRLASIKARKNGTRVFYTAHGFHFYKGAPLKYWILFYPIEKLLARYTDLLITINQEDYELTQKKHFRAKTIIKTDGVGVDFSKFSVVTDNEKVKIRSQYGYDKEAFIMLYAADLSKRKNQQMLLKAVALAKDAIPNAKLLLPGQPILLDEYSKLAEDLGIRDRVEFMGYRRDIDNLLALCDCVVSSARQEGLPLNLVEAAARGKYIIASNCRGNIDVVNQSNYGVIVELDDYQALADEMIRFYVSNRDSNSNVNSVGVYEQENVLRTIIQYY